MLTRVVAVPICGIKSELRDSQIVDNAQYQHRQSHRVLETVDRLRLQDKRIEVRREVDDVCLAQARGRWMMELHLVSLRSAKLIVRLIGDEKALSSSSQYFKSFGHCVQHNTSPS